MRLARAQARVTDVAAALRSIVAMDVARYDGLASRLLTCVFDPALQEAALEADERFSDEALRLVENVQAAMVRLHRHLGSRDA